MDDHCSENGATILYGCDGFINEYLALAAKGTAIDDMVRHLPFCL